MICFCQKHSSAQQKLYFDMIKLVQVDFIIILSKYLYMYVHNIYALSIYIYIYAKSHILCMHITSSDPGIRNKLDSFKYINFSKFVYQGKLINLFY